MISTMDEAIEKCGRPGSHEIDKHYYRVKGNRLDFDREGRLIPINEIEQESGVTNRSTPAFTRPKVQSFSIRKYAVLKIVFDGDTYPNKWYIWYVTGADLALHETFFCVSGSSQLLWSFTRTDNWCWRTDLYLTNR